MSNIEINALNESLSQSTGLCSTVLYMTYCENEYDMSCARKIVTENELNLNSSQLIGEKWK